MVEFQRADLNRVPIFPSSLNATIYICMCIYKYVYINIYYYNVKSMNELFDDDLHEISEDIFFS